METRLKCREKHPRNGSITLQYSPPLQFRNAGAYLGVSGKLLLGVVVGVKGGALEKFYK